MRGLNGIFRSPWLALLALIGSCAAAPERPVDLALPPAGFAANAGTGQALFEQYCANCHGPRGAGSDKGPPLVHKIYRASHHSDMSFYKAVQRGVYAHHWRFGDMPAIAGVGPESVAHIIAYVRSQQHAAGID